MTQTSKPISPTKPDKRRGRDAFVLTAMTLVAAAIGIGMYTQLGVGAAQAGLIAALLFFAALAGHVAIRRGRSIAALNAEVTQLNIELTEHRRNGTLRPSADPSRMERVAQSGPRQSQSVPAPAMPRVPAAISGPAPAIQARAQHIGPPPLVQHPIAGPAASPARHVPKTPERLIQGRGNMADEPTPRSGPPPLPPPPQPATDWLDVVPRQGSQSPPSALVDAQQSLQRPADTETMIPYWTLRPGVHREPVLATDPITPMGPLPILDANSSSAAFAGTHFESQTAVASALPPEQSPALSVPPFHKPMRANASGLEVTSTNRKLGQTEIPPARSEVNELASMERLIKQLANQLNQPIGIPADCTTIAPPDGGLSDQPGALAVSATEQSITALAGAAATMRQALADETSDGHNAASAKTHFPSYGRLALIAEAVTADRIDVYLEPILTLDERKARHFEISVRLRSDAGEEFGTEDYASPAAGTGLLALIDSAKLTHAAKIASRLRAKGSSASLFSTVSGESLADDTFLSSFADAFGDDEHLDKRMILTFAQHDVRTFTDAHWEAVGTMAEVGFRFALESVDDLDMDFAALLGHGFQYIKLDSAIFLQGMPTADGIIPASDLCRHLSDLGLSLIVGAIASERDLAKILGFGVIFGQGTLFGGARAVRIDPSAEAQAA